MSKDNGCPAFPTSYQHNQQTIEGMTLRDWFAGQALSGMLARQPGTHIEIFAGTAYEYADAMISERDRDQ